MSAPDYTNVAKQLRDRVRVAGYFELQDADLKAAAKLCEAVPAIEALLLELVALRECPSGEEDWDALCIAEDRVRKALQP